MFFRGCISLGVVVPVSHVVELELDLESEQGDGGEEASMAAACWCEIKMDVDKLPPPSVVHIELVGLVRRYLATATEQDFVEHSILGGGNAKPEREIDHDVSYVRW